MDINLVTLTTSIMSYTIEANTSMFSVTDGRVVERLRETFEQDPRWRVGLWEGQTVAWPRQGDRELWTSAFGGYQSTFGATARGLFRFQERPAAHPWQTSELVARNAAGTQAMKVKGWKVSQGPWEGQTAAAFTVDGPGVSFEMHEIAPQLGLQATQAALRDVTLRAQMVTDQVARGELQRSTLAMVPRGEPRIGDPYAFVTVSGDAVEVRGRVNPGEPGWIWVRLVDPRGERWHEEEVAVWTAERIGWDAQPTVVSYFQSTVPQAMGLFPEGTVEVWFRADKTAEVRKVAQFPYRLLAPTSASPLQGIEQ